MRRFDLRPTFMFQGWAAALGRWALVGFVHGSLLYGGVISLLHLVHNRIPSVSDGLVLLAVCAAVYGLASAFAFVAGGVIGRIGSLLLPGRWRSAPGAAPALVMPAFAYTFAFWFLYFNFALHYDQIPWVAAPDIRHMLVLLAVRTILVAAGSWLLAILVSAAVRALGERGLAFRATALGWLVILAVHVILAWRYTPVAVPEVALEEVPQIDRDAGFEGPKVVLLGIDGADWQVIDDLFAAGELPQLRSFVENGATGPLASIPDANSASIWASIYTGREPHRHTVLDFYTIDLPGMSAPGFFPVHRTYFKEAVGVLERLGLAQRVTVDRSNLRSVLLWEIATALGRTIGVVDGYYYSFPAPKLDPGAGYYLAYGTSDYLAQIEAADRDEALSSLFASPTSLVETQAGNLEGADFEWQSRVLLDLLDRGEQPDLVSLYTHEPDSSQHGFWKWYQPRFYLGVDEAEVEEKGEIIPDFYRELDAFLGRLLPRLEPNTVVMIVSDHGHTPCILHHQFQTWHRHGPPGVILMRGGPVRRGVRLEDADIYDVLPTILHLLALPVPADGDGETLVEAFEPGFRGAAAIPSYDFLQPRFSVVAGQGSAARNAAEIERLKNLGYI
ncbi:MAG: alkaline phosphatase family protein [Thermoanaerobaculia bacterium]|nr:alkaline phosphatase family protein [Thermoanaerobaculia bacterium]